MIRFINRPPSSLQHTRSISRPQSSLQSINQSIKQSINHFVRQGHFKASSNAPSRPVHKQPPVTRRKRWLNTLRSFRSPFRRVMARTAAPVATPVIGSTRSSTSTRMASATVSVLKATQSIKDSIVSNMPSMSSLPSLPSLPSMPSLAVLQALPLISSLDLSSLSSFTKEVELKPSPSDSQTAHVRFSAEGKLCDEELRFIQQRRSITSPNLQRLVSPEQTSQSITFSSSSSHLPSVALCLSGGGYRAMLGSMSAMNEFQKLGLLSCTDFVSGLSGSTWTLAQIYSRPEYESSENDRSEHSEAPKLVVSVSDQDTASVPLVSSAQIVEPIVLQDVLDTSRRYVSQPLFNRTAFSSSTILCLIRRTMQEKMNSNQSVTVNDILSWFLTQRVLSAITPDLAPDEDEDSEPGFIDHLTLSAQRHALRDGLLPFPIYTAVSHLSHVQFEFTPFEVGTHELNAFVPTWGFNRVYENGTSVNPPPNTWSSREPHLSTLLSTFSSAHCTDLQRQMEEIVYQMKSDRLKDTGKEIVDRLRREFNLSDIYPFQPVLFNNFMHSLPRDKRVLFASENEAATSPSLPVKDKPVAPTSIYDSPQLSLMDAGLAFNYPMVPLIQPAREVDVIVLCDFTSPPEAMNGVYLKILQRYAALHELPLPDLRKGEQPLGAMQVCPDEHVSTEKIDPLTSSDAETRALYLACHSRVTVFRGDPARRIPSIIYIPLLANDNFDPTFCPREIYSQGGFTSTLNFVYSDEQSAQLCGLVEANIAECDPVIRDIIKWTHEQKQRAAQIQNVESL